MTGNSVTQSFARRCRRTVVELLADMALAVIFCYVSNGGIFLIP